MPISRRYSPPFQAPAPKPGADDMGRKVKGLIAVEVNRSNEISFALESFGCDGKPVLSLLRGLPCESTGKLVVAGTKNGMPFSLNGDLPRGLGSAIRGAGGSLRQVVGGAALRAVEWVLFDNFGNHWSLDTLTGGEPTYLGETPEEWNGDPGPALCTQDPKIRPYEKKWEYIGGGGDPPVPEVVSLWAGTGWIADDSATPVIAYPVAYPYSSPASYYRIEQWIPDETTPPTGGSHAASWPGSHRHIDVEWYPAVSYTPNDWRDETTNSVDVIVSKYAGVDPEAPYGTRVYMNRWTRPLLEHLSIGGIAGEAGLLICVEKDLKTPPFLSRVALYGKSTGALLSTASLPFTISDGRAFLTPYKTEGWLVQSGAFTGSTATIYPFHSRATSTAAYGSALTPLSSLSVTLPGDAAHAWASEPVWFRVGKLTRLMGGTPTLVPLLPRWS